MRQRVARDGVEQARAFDVTMMILLETADTHFYPNFVLQCGISRV